jgi:hypothetical protein
MSVDLVTALIQALPGTCLRGVVFGVRRPAPSPAPAPAVPPRR